MVGKFARQAKPLLLHEQTPLAQFYSLQATLCFVRNWNTFVARSRPGPEQDRPFSRGGNVPARIPRDPHTPFA